MKLVWDEVSKKLYETGVRMGVLYPQDPATGLYPRGVAWNGLTAVSESPSGAEANKVYADDGVYLNLLSNEEFGATVEAYTYPDEYAACDGSSLVAPGAVIGQQTRQTFGLCYRTVLGNDVSANDYGYKLHLVYGAKAAPSEKAYATVNESPEAITFSWELTTTPVPVTGYKPTASFIIDSTKVSAAIMSAIEDILYGTAGADPRLPLPDEIIAIMGGAAPQALALSSTVPADDALNAAKATTIVLTFNNKILREAIAVIAEDGTMVAVTRTWDADGKVLTLTPTAPLTGTTLYIVSITGVVDIYNQALAQESRNFTTVA
jgi:methionine-rich copper-binding protein CopC